MNMKLVHEMMQVERSDTSLCGGTFGITFGVNRWSQGLIHTALVELHMIDPVDHCIPLQFFKDGPARLGRLRWWSFA